MSFTTITPGHDCAHIEGHCFTSGLQLGTI